MINYWIFKIKDDSDGKYSFNGIAIYRHRMTDKSWGIHEKKENGARAANVSLLERGDKAVFYLSGQDGHCFLGTAMLDTGFPLVPLIVHKEFLDWTSGVKLTDITQWVNPVHIGCLEGRVSFYVRGEKNWGAHLQGAITRISESDYEIIKAAADKTANAR